MKIASKALAAAALAALPGVVQASDLFQVTAITTSGAPLTISAGGENMPDLIENVINTQGDFAQLGSRDFSGTLTYAGVPNAMIVDVNAEGTQAVLRIPSTGLVKVFNAANREDLEDQVVDWIKEDGSSEYAKFLREIEKESLVGVVDGNPSAATAFMANHIFDRYALHNVATLARPEYVQAGPGSAIRLEGGFSTIDTDHGDGTSANLSLGTGIAFSESVALESSMAFMYRDIEGSESYVLGVQLGLPIAIVRPSEENGLQWRVTPFIFAAGAGSIEYASGAVMYGGGISNMVSYRLGNLILSMGNQITLFESSELSYGDYSWDADISQQLLSNGIKATYFISEQVFVDGSITHHNYLDDAAVEDWFSPAAGVGWAFNDASGLRLGYRADIGDDYTSHGGTLLLYFGW